MRRIMSTESTQLNMKTTPQNLYQADVAHGERGKELFGKFATLLNSAITLNREVQLQDLLQEGGVDLDHRCNQLF